MPNLKLTVLSESSADEAAIRVLINAIIGQQSIEIKSYDLRSRGWPSVKQVLPSMLNDLYYRSEAEALAVVVDSDDSTPHQATHNFQQDYLNCRLCELSLIIDNAKNRLRPLPNRDPIKTAVGLAVPAIEAWYLCGKESYSHVTEAAWVNGLQNRRKPYSKNNLKQYTYGTDRPPIVLEKQHAIEECNRLGQDLQNLELWFPGGFGTFAKEIRTWVSQPSGEI